MWVLLFHTAYLEDILGSHGNFHKKKNDCIDLVVNLFAGNNDAYLSMEGGGLTGFIFQIAQF